MNGSVTAMRREVAMTTEDKLELVREAVAVFKTAPDLEAAIDDLLESGFDRAHLSLLAPAETVDIQLGHHFIKVRELEDDPAAPRAPMFPGMPLVMPKAPSSAGWCMSVPW
jgi:hypothetical protein